MKVKLLNDGSYAELANCKFPVVLESTNILHFKFSSLINIPGGILANLEGVDLHGWEGWREGATLAFWIGSECEILEE